MENAHDGHRQRIRDKILSGGPEAMKPHEIVEFLLYYCVPRQNTNPMAHALLARFGSLEQLFRADEAEMMQVEGITASCAQWLRAVGDCVQAYIDTEERHVILTNRREAREYMIDFFEQSGFDGCWMLCLNAAGCVTHTLPLHRDAWHTPANLRRASSFALQCRAHSIILVQRRADYLLTEEEVQLTARLMDSLALIRITLIEHMTLDLSGSCVNYASNPLLRDLQQQPAQTDEDIWLLAHWLDET